MKIVYFDCGSGISGDMCLAALIDAGAKISALKSGLSKIPVKGYRIIHSRVHRCGIDASRLEVKLTSDSHPARRLKDVKKIISSSKLHPKIKSRGMEIFGLLFNAEASVHGVDMKNAHLHEIAAVDAIVDIMGTLILLDSLGINKVVSSPVNLGSGVVKTSHGVLPVPAPATAEILKGVPVYGSGDSAELATPTGAGIIKIIAESFGPMPHMTVSNIGTGAGARDLKGRPNVLRVMVGEGTGKSISGEALCVLETNIDDMDPRIYGHVMDMLFDAGALDVWLTQIIMKKSRPGVMLSVLCNEPDKPKMMDIILKETTTLGVRFYNVGRAALNRRLRKINTRFGAIRVKDAVIGDKVIKSMPEYEDCRRAALRHKAPLQAVIDEAHKKSR